MVNEIKATIATIFCFFCNIAPSLTSYLFIQINVSISILILYFIQSLYSILNMDFKQNLFY